MSLTNVLMCQILLLDPAQLAITGKGLILILCMKVKPKICVKKKAKRRNWVKKI